MDRYGKLAASEGATRVWNSPGSENLIGGLEQATVVSDRAQRISHEMDVHAARTSARHISNDAKLSPTDTAAYVTGVSELAMNTLMHGGGGRLVQRCVLDQEGRYAAVAIAEDQGGGIEDIEKALEDGYSTTGSLGGGLPGAARLLDCLRIESSGNGTRIFGAKRSQHREEKQRASFSQIEKMVVSAPGERVSGDAVFTTHRGGVAHLALFDGVGHGKNAHQAASAGVAHYKENLWRTPEEIVAGLHDALRGSVGVAFACFHLSSNGKEGRFFGVGNVRGRLLDDRRERYFESDPGILGDSYDRLNVESIDIVGRGVALLFSDGIANRFSLGGLACDRRQVPLVAARRILDTHRVERDDASLVVAW
ncbi:hypothetical protein QEH56_18995 [Pelagicoccus enzymogenes]|uniref:hypothetical protein n=1 Tax=Pelagicoccus enzymogenes TaxID=2773457 RepID=UPI00280CD54A|nr:hypothetical protein [Pelagicoccus enzymogenes]MDQ8200258.1 hypothetical protein [Pelagicoccus enzymogenes]